MSQLYAQQELAVMVIGDVSSVSYEAPLGESYLVVPYLCGSPNGRRAQSSETTKYETPVVSTPTGDVQLPNFAIAQHDPNYQPHIHRLPPELLLIILHLALPSKAWMRDPIRLDRNPQVESDMRQLRDMMGVCSMWRSLIDSAPYFWAQIWLMDGEIIWKHNLRKSGGIPLDVYGPIFHWKEIMARLLEAIRPEYLRWRTVEVVVGGEIMDTVLEALQSPTPMLEEALLARIGPTKSRFGFPPLHIFPNLRLLSLEGVEFYATSRWSEARCCKLERLRLWYVTVPNQRAIADLLHQCPNLVMLCLQEINCPPNHSQLKGTPVTLEKLELLQLFIHPGQPLPPTGDFDLLPILHTPALRKVGFDCDASLVGCTASLANVVNGFPDAQGVPTVEDAPIPSVLRNTGAAFGRVRLVPGVHTYQAFTKLRQRDRSAKPIAKAIRNTLDLDMTPVIHYSCDVQSMLLSSQFQVDVFIDSKRQEDNDEASVLRMLRNLPGTTDVYITYKRDARERLYLLESLASSSLCPRLRSIHLVVKYPDPPVGLNSGERREILELLKRMRRARGISEPASGVSVYVDTGNGERDVERLNSC